MADNVAEEVIPTDNSSLVDEAQLNGCDYQGPTTIVLNGTTMKVKSPGTPTGKPTGAPGSSPSNDSLNDAANTNVCMPSAPGGSVAIPANGVVYVDELPDHDFARRDDLQRPDGYNPLSAAGETGVGGYSVGDAIIQGSVNSPMTIGTANNIIIDGNLCYADTMSSGNVHHQCPGGTLHRRARTGGHNYVEINHPVDSHGNNESIVLTEQLSGFGGGHVRPVEPDHRRRDPGAQPLVPRQQLQHRATRSARSTLNGTIDQDWRGPGGDLVRRHASSPATPRTTSTTRASCTCRRRTT